MAFGGQGDGEGEGQSEGEEREIGGEPHACGSVCSG
jgi:hypothetical protein